MGGAIFGFRPSRPLLLLAGQPCLAMHFVENPRRQRPDEASLAPGRLDKSTTVITPRAIHGRHSQSIALWSIRSAHSAFSFRPAVLICFFLLITAQGARLIASERQRFAGRGPRAPRSRCSPHFRSRLACMRAHFAKSYAKRRWRRCWQNAVIWLAIGWKCRFTNDMFPGKCARSSTISVCRLSRLARTKTCMRLNWGCGDAEAS